jgi:hypothetical protein
MFTRSAGWMGCLLALILMVGSGEGRAQVTESPWGIAGSSSSARDIAEWFPQMAAAGVTTVRLFPEWRGTEPAKGNWQWDRTDALPKAAAMNKIEINGILMGSTPWVKGKGHAFPMDHLEDWSDYVTGVVGHYKGQVRYWEVWNEGNGGFNDNHNTTADYAKLAAAAYAAGKKADAEAKIGLSVASYDPAYLNQAILAMAKEGKADSFDFLCVHPYEIADGLNDPDGEIPYLWMTRTIREMLKASAPARKDAEIWITEVGQRIGNRGGRVTSEMDAARSLVKLYTMAIAQGIRRTEWFEGRDPAGEEAGFGLLARDGKPRAAYRAMGVMTRLLGQRPKYVGWMALGEGGRGYGFVFEGASGTVMAAWMPAGGMEKVLLGGDVEVIDGLSGISSKVTPGERMSLSDAPVFVVGLPSDFVAKARANAEKKFPWGGDCSKVDTVSVTLGKADGEAGVFQVGRAATPHCTFADGSTGIIVRGDQRVSFYVHPSFASFATDDYYVRLTVRRLAPGNLGMNCYYEVADSQGRGPYKNREQWYTVPKEEGWHTQIWHVTGACFAKMWGYDITFGPEQSVPFVIGKVEISKTPLK